LLVHSASGRLGMAEVAGIESGNGHGRNRVLHTNRVRFGFLEMTPA
jgi:hypothetical protein